MAILLIPGFMLDSTLWRAVEPALSRWSPLIHLDTTQDSTLEDIARRALVSAPARFVLLGFSMGGYVAREMVRQAPDRVKALVLIATSARGDSDVQAKRKAALAGQSGAQSFRGLSAAAIASSLHPDNAGRQDLVATIQHMGHRLGSGVFRRQSLVDRTDQRGSLSAIDCPTLVVAGGADRLRSRQEASELHEGIKGSRIEIVEQAGHMIPLEQPDLLGRIISDWLSERAIS